MRRAIWFVVGCGLGFLAVLVGGAALGLTILGVGGGALIRWNPAAQENLNFSPLRVASAAPFAAGASLVLVALIVGTALWLGKKQTPRPGGHGVADQREA